MRICDSCQVVKKVTTVVTIQAIQDTDDANINDTIFNHRIDLCGTCIEKLKFSLSKLCSELRHSNESL